MVMEPSLKKQKVDTSPPVIFHATGLKPDVRFKVFGKAEFHVHSIVLKLHSQFFFTFLDSPEKKGLGSTTTDTAFRYEWESRIDEDGNGWHLAVSTSLTETNSREAKDEIDMDLETTCFEKLLCAMYAERYKLGSSQELLIITDMADYYRCLPILSRTLDGAFYASHSFAADIEDNCTDLLIAATKLRNAMLFRESLVWVVSFWPDPEFIRLRTKSWKLYKLADSVYNTIALYAAHAQHKIMNAMLQEEGIRGDQNTRNLISEIAKDSTDQPIHNVFLQVFLPQYLRNINEDIRWTEEIDEIDILLCNRLTFSKGNSEPGVGDYCNHFLCARIEDEDLPWDPTEKDW